MSKQTKTRARSIRRNGHKPPNALLYVDATRKRVLRHVPKNKIPKGSMPMEMGKRLSLHVLNVNGKGELRTITVPKEIKENDSPKDLWFALNCEQEVNETYHMPEGIWNKVSYVAFFVLLFAELIVVFLIAAGAMK